MNDTYEWMYIESWTLEACPRVYASCVPSYTYLESYFSFLSRYAKSPRWRELLRRFVFVFFFAFMHGRRIKDDKVNYPLQLLRGKNNEDDFPSAQKSSLPPSQRFSLSFQCFHKMTELSPTTMCRWRDDTFLEKIESSSHPSVIIRSVRVADTCFLCIFRDKR